jgi:hypothetical protein
MRVARSPSRVRDRKEQISLPASRLARALQLQRQGSGFFRRQRDRSVACANLPGHNPHETLGHGCRQPGGYASAHERWANVGDSLSPRLRPERKRRSGNIFGAISRHPAIRRRDRDFRGLQCLADHCHWPGIPSPEDERFRSFIFSQALERPQAPAILDCISATRPP